MIGAVGSSFCPENTQIELAWAGPCVGFPLPVISPAKAGAGIAITVTTIAATVSHFLMKAPPPYELLKIREPNSTCGPLATVRPFHPALASRIYSAWMDSAQLAHTGSQYRADQWSSPLAGLVVTALGLADDVQPVVGVDEGDEGHQRGELVRVVVLGRVRPGLVGDTAGGVGDAGALLGELQGGPLGFGEDLRVPPGRHQVEPHPAFPRVLGVLGVHVGADRAAVDLTGPDLHQLLCRGRQRRAGDDRAGGCDVLGELRRDRVAVGVQTGVHAGFLP